LVVVEDELDGPAEQATLLVDVVFPDLDGQEGGLAVGGEPAREGHAEADLYWVGGVGDEGAREHQRAGDRPHEKPSDPHSRPRLPHCILALCALPQGRAARLAAQDCVKGSGLVKSAPPPGSWNTSLYLLLP